MRPDQIESWVRKPLDNAIFLTGSTASGKSDAALELADRIGAEIISVDSMAVYRDMDIGTAKPTPLARERIPHHLIDVVDPTLDYSVSQFVLDAHERAAEIRSRGNRVLLVGGTPLYLKSLLCGMFLGPPADWEFREAVAADLERFGVDALRERLAMVDPLSAHRILPGDARRMVRALEVAKLTGSPLSHWQTQFERTRIPSDAHAFVIAWARDALHERVSQRVEAMFEQGLLDEVEQLKQKYGSLGRTASQAVGYKEPLDYLAGKIDQSTMVEQVKAHTRQLVRRQEIWFRSMPQMHRLPVASDEDLRSLPDRIESALKDRQVA